MTDECAHAVCVHVLASMVAWRAAPQAATNSSLQAMRTEAYNHSGSTQLLSLTSLWLSTPPNSCRNV